MINGIESKSLDVPVKSIEKAVENAGFGPIELIQLYRLFGRRGIDKLIRMGSIELAGELHWPDEKIYSLKRGIYPNNFPPKDKKID